MMNKVMDKFLENPATAKYQWGYNIYIYNLSCFMGKNLGNQERFPKNEHS